MRGFVVFQDGICTTLLLCEKSEGTNMSLLGSTKSRVPSVSDHYHAAVVPSVAAISRIRSTWL